MNYFSLHRNIQLRLALQFFTTFASSTVFPFLAIFFLNQVGEVATGSMYIGVIISGIFGALYGGRRTDRIGRKNTILLCESMVALGYFIAAICNLYFEISVYVNFVFFLIIIFFTGMVTPAYSAIIIDSTAPENRKEVYTLSYWFNNLAVAAGGLTGAVLFQTYTYQLFLGIAFITFLSFIITKKWLQEPNKHISVLMNESVKNHKTWQQSYKEILLNKRFVFFTVAGLFLIALEESLTTYIGIKLVKDIKNPMNLFPFTSFFEVDGFQLIGLLKAENTIAVVILSLFIMKMLKKYQDRILMQWGAFCYAFGYVVISYSVVPGILMIAMLISTVGELAHIPAKQAYVASIVPDNSRGTYMAVYSLSFQISAMIASLFVMISSVFSANFITLLFILMSGTSLIIYFVLLNSEQKEKTKLQTTA
jgi:DHA1 family multidrug resistance protein B-like MFS transporter